MIERLDFHYGAMDDLADIYAIVDMVGWGETKENIRSVIANPDNRYITLIDKEGEIIGIILAVKNEQHGSIGHVIVKPEYRKMGLGEQLMIEAINYLKTNNCTTVRLDAVQLARSLYERVGFTFEVNSLRFKKLINKSSDVDLLLNVLNKIEQKNPVHHIKENDLSDIIDKDKAIFGVSRRNFLFYLFEEYPDFSFISRNQDDEVNGYLFGSYQEGVLQLRAGYGENSNITANLLKAAFLIVREDDSLEAIKIGIVENSVYGIPLLKELGFEHYYTSLRMYFGEKNEISIHPKLFAIGDPAKG